MMKQVGQRSLIGGCGRERDPLPMQAWGSLRLGMDAVKECALIEKLLLRGILTLRTTPSNKITPRH